MTHITVRHQQRGRAEAVRYEVTAIADAIAEAPPRVIADLLEQIGLRLEGLGVTSFLGGNLRREARELRSDLSDVTLVSCPPYVPRKSS